MLFGFVLLAVLHVSLFAHGQVSAILFYLTHIRLCTMQALSPFSAL